MAWEVIEGDCVKVMAVMDEASVDAIVTDPPYLLNFMGKDFDSQDGAHGDPQRMQEWHHAWAIEALRVLKPGGHLLAFGGTRTYHRLACAVEDAGFEIRDSLIWLYGSGFPKSLDVSKAIDRAAGAEREILREATYEVAADGNAYGGGINTSKPRADSAEISAPATPEAAEWQGWGTALKPGHEPIVVARKPLSGTVAQTVLEHGTGALNIDATRIGWGGDGDQSAARKAQGYSDTAKKALGGVVASESDTGFSGEVEGSDASSGRWPTNVALSHSEGCVLLGTVEVASDGHYPAARGAGGLGTSGHVGQDGLDERHTRGEEVEQWSCAPGCPVAALDEQTGILSSGSEPASGFVRNPPPPDHEGIYGGGKGLWIEGQAAGALYGDSGGASRFFFCAKPSATERTAGLDRRNGHPTVKPINLMRWLCRLVTPPGGLILDPFCGSGTTGAAADLEGFDFTGVERDPEYAELARARIAYWSDREGVPTDVVLSSVADERDRREAGQLGLEMS